MGPRPLTFAPAAAFRFLLLAGLLGGCGALRRSDPPLDRTHDPRIRGQVEARLAAEPSLESASIRVEVDGGTVLLHGGAVELASARGIKGWRLTMTHTHRVAEAIAVALDAP